MSEFSSPLQSERRFSSTLYIDARHVTDAKARIVGWELWTGDISDHSHHHGYADHYAFLKA